MAFNSRETILLLSGDFLILTASLWITLFLRNLSLPPFSYFETNLIPFLPMFLISLLVFYIAGLYEKQTKPIRSVMSVRIFGAQAATVAISAVLFFILPFSIAPKTILVLYLIVSVIAASLWRFYNMGRGVAETNRISAILIGSGTAVSELYDEINGNARYQIRFMNRIEAGGAISDAVVSEIKSGARVVVADTSDSAIARGLSELSDLMSNGVSFIEFASLYEEIFDRVPLAHVDSKQLLDLVPKHRSLYDIAKRVFDIVLALILSAIAIPVITLSALALFFESGDPFLHPERIGRGGRIIRLLKLRTMLFNDNGDPQLQKKNQITAIGKVLRKTRIDELPQLWNILIGDLSFIGPRPEFSKIVEVYEKEVPHYRMRHLIAPGLSGWAQIHDYDAPRGGADVERTKRKLSFDLYYLKHRSFGLDLGIAIKTLRALSSFSGT